MAYMARCQEPGCSWSFGAEDYKSVDDARIAHFMTHPMTHGMCPRYPAMSDSSTNRPPFSLEISEQFGTTVLDAKR